MARRRISEAETRKKLIDPQLEKAGWSRRDKTKVGTEIPAMIPPSGLQGAFAGVVARVEGLRGRMSEAERQLEMLFQSLLSQSFGG